MNIIGKRTVLGHVIVSLSDVYLPSRHRGLFELGFAPLPAPPAFVEVCSNVDHSGEYLWLTAARSHAATQISLSFAESLFLPLRTCFFFFLSRRA